MKNYIFGTGPFAIEVAKKLNNFNIAVDGFLKLGVSNKDSLSQNDSSIPIIYLNDNSYIDKSSNIIITKKAIIMGETIDYLRKNNFRNVYVVSEDILYSEQASFVDMKKFIEKIDLSVPFINYLEMNVVDHCNLNCKGCAHFSNVCDKNCVDLEQYKSDLKIISKKFNVYYFRILGGEPLLHPKLKQLLEITRELLVNTRIVIVTNGLLIPKLSKDILQMIANNDIMISISLYKPTFEKLDDILKILKNYDIKFLINDDYFRPISPIEKFQTSLSLEKKSIENNSDKVCTGRFCRFLRDGKISKCYYPLLIEILNKKYGTNFELSEIDYVELATIKNGWDVIEQLNNRIPFCDYCREEIEEFDWESHFKNDKCVSNFVLKKLNKV